MGKFRKIIFLGEDNTRLGPLAEAALTRKLAIIGIYDVAVASAGTVVLFPEPVNQKIAEVAERNGLDISKHRATQVLETDFSESTLVLAVGAESKRRCYSRFPQAVNVYTIKEYLGQEGDLKLPYGGTVEEYEAVYLQLEGLLDALIRKLTEA